MLSISKPIRAAGQGEYYLNLAREVLQKNKMTALTQEQKEIKVQE